MCETNQNSKLVRALRQVMEEECEKYRKMSEECNHVFSERFERKITILIKKSKKIYYPLINTGFKRAVCVIIAITSLFGGIMSVEATRETIKRFVYFTNNETDMTKILSVENAEYPTLIEDIYEITYDLTGYEIHGLYYDAGLYSDY